MKVLWWLVGMIALVLFVVAGWMVLIREVVAQEPEFDSWLVLVVDVSDSVKEDEYQIQHQGYVQVLLDPLMANSLDRTAVAIVEFSSTAKTVVEWTDLQSAGRAYILAERSSRDKTCVVCAIEHAIELLEGKSGRRILDISGDGCENVKNTPPWRIQQAVDRATKKNIKINTLAILVQPDNSRCQWNSSVGTDRWEGDTALARWYERLATGFAMSIGRLEDLQRALRFKLHAEVAGLHVAGP